jgi:two-component system chemotaxis response regulator CheY
MVTTPLTLLLKPFDKPRRYKAAMGWSSSVKGTRQAQLEGQRILVVDDNAPSAALLRYTLMAAGAAEVRIAADGQEALGLLATFRPDVLVTDMVMPVIGGLELVRAVRQSAHAPSPDVPDPAIPIVLVSAFGSRSAVRAAQAAGIDAFVVKPFSVASLIKRVHRAVNRSATFVVAASYVGPDRRGLRGGPGNRRRSDRAAALPLTEPAVVPPPLMLAVDRPEPAPGEETNSMLKHLYERIRELEEERAAAINPRATPAQP